MVRFIWAVLFVAAIAFAGCSDDRVVTEKSVRGQIAPPAGNAETDVVEVVD